MSEADEIEEELLAIEREYGRERFDEMPEHVQETWRELFALHQECLEAELLAPA